MVTQSRLHPCIGAALVLCGANLLTGCGPTRLVIRDSVPAPQVTSLPLNMGLRVPESFSTQVQKETVGSSSWEILLGPAQVAALRRVASAMFAQISVFTASDSATGVDGVVETSLDSYIYLLPSSGTSNYYSANIGYKVNLQAKDGTLIGSWIYEGYGSVPSRRVNTKEGVMRATELAIRDAFANFAVHLPQQDLVLGLLPQTGRQP
jgi:hypothetical protein